MIYLASQSPRRAQLLQQIGVAFHTEPADIDETPLPQESAEDFIRRVAIAKARAVKANHPDAVVLGSDTAVVLDGHILGKPKDRQHGIDMLQKLSGREHRVLTGVAVLAADIGYALSDSRVYFRAIPRAEAERYWESGEPADKAGGYAIQGHAAVFVRELQGSYSGVMGLPLFETAQLLSAAGIQI